jgi:hypothetical protein
MTPGVANGGDKNEFVSNDISDVVGEPWQVHPAPTSWPLPPKQWKLHNRHAGTFDLGAKPHAEAWNLSLVVARDALNLRSSFRKKLELRELSRGSYFAELAKDVSGGDSGRLASIKSCDSVTNLSVPSCIWAGSVG